MALNRWFGALMIASVFGFVGCTQPQPKDTGSTPSAPSTPVAVVTETPAPVATGTPSDTGTPADSAATPGASGTPVAAAAGGDGDADFENAEGMAGYEEVKALTVPASTPEMLAKGKEVFAANCASCHGAEGAGDGDAGKALDPPPRNFAATGEYKYGHMEKAIYRTGMYGIDGTGMAPLEGVVSPEDMWAVSHYVMTLQK